MSGESLEARLRHVQEEFLRSLPGRIGELERAWDGDQPLLERLKLAHQLAHRLSGGAGTLGQAAVSAAAKTLELDLRGWIEAGRLPDAPAIARFRQRSRDLLAAIQPPPA